MIFCFPHSEKPSLPKHHLWPPFIFPACVLLTPFSYGTCGVCHLVKRRPSSHFWCEEQQRGTWPLASSLCKNPLLGRGALNLCVQSWLSGRTAGTCLLHLVRFTLGIGMQLYPSPARTLHRHGKSLLIKWGIYCQPTVWAEKGGIRPSPASSTMASVPTRSSAKPYMTVKIYWMLWKETGESESTAQKNKCCLHVLLSISDSRGIFRDNRRENNFCLWMDEWYTNPLLLTTLVYIYIFVLVRECAEGCLPNWPRGAIKLNKITVHSGPLNMAF